jgi:CRP/FNR family transcriptional regulator
MLLRMRRAEIASLLGVSLETVSRCFTRLQAERLIEAENRHVAVLDEARLARAAGR